jgi:long-chain acyl-CoA synthetase
MNIATHLEISAFHFPNRPALCEDSVEITFEQLNDRANRIATGLLQLGVRPGELIGIFAPNSSDWIAVYFGILKTGAVAVTYSSLLMREEIEPLIHHAKPKILFTFDEKLDDLADIRKTHFLEKVICPDGDMSLDQLIKTGSGSFKAIDREPSDTAAVLYTGGTTGIPKGVMLTHENITTSAHNARFYERSVLTDRALLFLPLNHVFGQIHIMSTTILSAGCLEMIPAFDLDRVLDLISQGRVSRFYAVPTLYVRLLAVQGFEEKLGAVRYCFSAASSMAAEIVRQWRERTDLSIYESYGMTESAAITTYNHYYRHVAGSVGTPVSGVEIQIRDKNGHPVKAGKRGEICLRGRNMMKGYLNNPEATQAAFWDGQWFRSGDVGVLDENGYLFIVDRIKDMIITGGENVYPREVEELLYTYPDVQECAVVGLPDPEWGERVTAYLILKPGKVIDSNELKSFLKSHLSPYKVPKDYRTVRDFPKSSTGKILKRELRKAAAQ